MAKVRCPCGRQYAIADEHLGRRVKCKACGRAFTARPTDQAGEKPPAAERPAPPRQPIGDRAVAAGLLSRQALDACLEYQMALNDPAEADDRRLGRILIANGLLTPNHFRQLVGLTRRGPASKPPTKARPSPQAEEAPSRATPATGRSDHPVGEEQREALRRTVEAAARQKAERKKPTTRMLPVTTVVRRVRLWHLGLVLLLAAAGVVTWSLWPPPEPARVLADYLASCSVDALAPDSTLAVRDLGIDVDHVGPVQLGEPTTYDFETELAAYRETKWRDTWWDFLRWAELPDDQKRALWMVAPALAEELTPKKAAGLTVTVRPAVVSLELKPRGLGSLRQARCRFFLVRATSGTWSLDWKVADYERAGAGPAEEAGPGTAAPAGPQ
ncbi:MAG: hypothetical protein ACODAJ_00100 [Planctomycetota bacterium]